MKVKSSFYNELIPIEETNEFLLYNLLSGGLKVLDSKTGKFISEKDVDYFFIPDSNSENSDELLDLVKEGYLVDYNLDEKAEYQNDYDNAQARKFRDSSHIGITIGTTILCNMGCPYCFQTVKPNETLRDEKIINGIVNYIEGMIHSAPVDKWKSLTITWFGGEPLINTDAIEILSIKFMNLAEKYDIPYNASIITNGILLDKKTWYVLKKNKVSSVQVTIDGSKEVHNIYRPLKSANGKNYEKILENLSIMPMGMQASIRINTDKRVAASIPQLLDDLHTYGIWPQRAASVNISLAWLRAYKGAENTAMINLTQEEFFEVNNQFRLSLVDRYNQWAKDNRVGNAKIKWHLPEKQSDCATYVSPYFFTFDPKGNIHKCWETVHDGNKSSGATVFQPWNAEDFVKYTDYSRATVHPVCYSCKYNPVCEGLTCSYDALDTLEANGFPCTAWKSKLPSYFKEMYLKMIQNPNQVSIEKPKVRNLQTHSNK